jgi:hypothetical protein
MDASVFDYMHDALLISMRCEFGPGAKAFQFVATLHDDCGDPELAGKTLVIRAEDITLVKAVVHGAYVGDECISEIEARLSGEAQAILAKGHAAGLRMPQGVFTLTTTSGSVWEVAFESLTVTDCLTNRSTGPSQAPAG